MPGSGQLTKREVLIWYEFRYSTHTFYEGAMKCAQYGARNPIKGFTPNTGALHVAFKIFTQLIGTKISNMEHKIYL